MRPTRMLVVAGCAVVLLGTAPAAFAQRGGGGHFGGGGGGGGHGGGAAISRGGGMAGGPMIRGPVGGMGSGPMVGPRQIGGMRGGPVVRGGGFVPGGSFDHRGPFVTNGGGFVHNGGGFVHNGRFIGGPFVAGRRFPIAPVHFFYPYYTFHPRLSLGFGFWAGYPFAYPYAYYNPFYYPGTYVTPYGDPTYSPDAAYPPDVTSSLEAQPSDANMGGVSFDVTPSTAELFVDDTLVGTVGQFTPTTQPLGLEAGHHRVEVRADGYQTLSFDVDVVAGQVIPFQGTLTR